MSESHADLPIEFVLRMQDLLGEDSDAFFASYRDNPVSGLRVNTLKISPERFLEVAPWQLQPVPWCPTGFYVPGGVRPGKHPFHAAGLYYLQEPSAMAVVEALDVQPGMRVLDLAASPGGKATQIAAQLDSRGWLIANDIGGPGRLKGLGENLERWGARNVAITHGTPDQLAERLGRSFDRVLLDAPCSGEGMFRKSVHARKEWSLQHVQGSARRQLQVIQQASRLVKPGGRLLYSTCTFSPEENEEIIARFLDQTTLWELAEIPKRDGISSGREDWAQNGAKLNLQRTGRLWPHQVHAEGHFFALLSNINSEAEIEPADEVRDEFRRVKDRRGKVGAPDAGSQAARAAWVEFQMAFLTVNLPPEHIRLRDDRLYLVKSACPDLHGIGMLRQGLWLGTMKPGRFEPAHALALALTINDAVQTISLPIGEAERYLRGESLQTEGPNGWVLVCVDEWPIGWARRVSGILKNLYPKGLRALA